MPYPTLGEQLAALNVDPKMALDLRRRLNSLRFYIGSSRFALTAEDVIWDYETGRNRYADAPKGRR
jgi:hypothetical protein